jgi:hypothetical protein
MIDEPITSRQQELENRVRELTTEVQGEKYVTDHVVEHAPRGEASASNWIDFKMGFRHPFGRHADEAPEDILPRKTDEVENNDGWTLWSFRYKKLEAWYQELIAATAPSVFVFCGTWEKTRDPGGLKEYCTQFRYVGSNEWQSVPQAIKVPHPFSRRGEREASAFVVETVEYPIRSFSRPFVEWFYEKGRIWRDGVEGARGVMHPYPTKGEYLIRPGGTHRMHQVGAILKLKYPYLAYVRI